MSTAVEQAPDLAGSSWESANGRARELRAAIRWLR
jgi:hypothetical protein